MADYIPPTLISVDDPGTAEWANMVQENPIAIAEGAAGAPRIQDGALSGTVTGAGQNWVNARIVSQAWNGVGQTVMASIFAITNPGVVVSGVSLVPSSAGGDFGGAGLPGSWRCQGRTTSAEAGDPESATTWLRVS